MSRSANANVMSAGTSHLVHVAALSGPPLASTALVSPLEALSLLEPLRLGAVPRGACRAGEDTAAMSRWSARDGGDVNASGGRVASCVAIGVRA